MVVFGGLELVAAGYLIHQHEQNKKEKRRLEEEARRRSRRRHSTSPPRHRHSKRSDGRAYEASSSKRRPSSTPRPGPLAPFKPSSSGSQQGASKLTAPAAMALHRPSSQPLLGNGNTIGHPTPALMNYGVPPHSPPPYPMSSPGHSYPPPPSTMQPDPFTRPGAQQQAQGQQQPNPAAEAHTFQHHLQPYAQDPRRRSDSSLPLGIYDPSDGVYELAADGPWMSDQHLTVHQRPHVRFDLGAHGVVAPSDEKGPPPAYRP